MLPTTLTALSFLGLTVLLTCAVANGQATTTTAPSGAVAAPDPEQSLTNEAQTLRFTLIVDKEGLAYRVDHLDAGGQPSAVIERSPLGLMRADADLASGLSFQSASPARVVEDEYTLSSGKQLKVRSRGVERTFSLRNDKGLRLDVVARAYRDGVAFRYAMPGHGSQLFQITGEATGFKLPADRQGEPAGRVWAQPYQKVDVWAPAYESNYVDGVAVGASAPAPEGWALPLLAHVRGRWVLITESGLEPNYFAVHLEREAPGGLYRVRLPEEPETYGVAPQPASVTLPWGSPWRVIVVSDRAGGVAESTLVTDLARPSEVADTSWIQPGVASWSWWSDMGSPYQYAKLVPFVDAAASFGWKYSLVDLGWHQMNGGSIEQLVAHARSKGVGLVVWYNSAGKHNRVPDATPKDLLNDPAVRDAELARIAAMGVKGIKVDFMQSDKQWVIALYHDILRDAAKHRLMVNFHGCTIPRGWQRTYPHLMSMEAVRGGEQYWDKTFAETAHTTNTIYVFTRNAVGPMDYTPTVFGDVKETNPQSQPHQTTNAHELALLVAFESGWQHVIDAAPSLMRQPDFVKDYLRDLPAAWDETRVLDGAPGDLAVVARRSGQAWYLSGINGRDEARTVRVPLSFLSGPAQGLLIADGAAPRDFAHERRAVAREDTLEFRLAPRGGFACRLSPARP